MKSILGFRGEYSWLSNMQQIEPISYQGMFFHSTENFYQAMKTLRMDLREEISFLPPKISKVFARGVPLREDWDQIKLDVMLYCNRIKYSQPKFKDLLLATGSAYIEETNWWGDTFWGVCKGVGDNNLGKIIMQIREEIK